MVPLQSLILVGASLVLLGASAEAQIQTRKRMPYCRAKATRPVTLDLATGTYTRGPVTHDRGGTTVTDFSNLDAGLTPFLAVDTGGCTWFSNASKGFGMHQGGQPVPGSDLMSDILFSYCSSALGVGSGGQGGTVNIGFYEGYTVFGGAPTTTATILALTGMPAATIPGGVRCYSATLKLDPMVAFSDNIFIGYSWEFVDAATFPFLACVVSCSGTSIFNGSAGGIGTATSLGEDGQGMLDVIDIFCPGSAVHSFTFATSGVTAPPWAPQTRTSIGMEIREATARATTDDDYNDAVPINNVDTLTATPATLGSIWTTSFTRAGGGSGRFQIRLWRDRLGGNGVSPTAGSVPWPAGTGGRRMTVGAYLGSIPPGQALAGSPVTPTLPFSGGVGTAAAGIPLDLVFCGLHFSCQARSGRGPLGGVTPRLSSAVEGTIGTF